VSEKVNIQQRFSSGVAAHSLTITIVPNLIVCTARNPLAFSASPFQSARNKFKSPPIVIGLIKFRVGRVRAGNIYFAKLCSFAAL